MKKLLFLLLLTIPVFASSQSRKMKKAKQYMEVLNYDKAIDLYLRIIDKKNTPAAQIGLAEAYLKNKDYKNASDAYQKVTLLPQARPIDFLNNGLLFLRAGECQKAQVNFDVFLKLKPYDSRKPQLANACQYYQDLLNKNTNKLTIDSLPINTNMPELGAAFFKNGIVYAAVRPDQNHGKSSFDLYFVDFQMTDSTGLQLGTEQVFAPSLNTLSNEAIPSFDSKGETIFFTRNQKSAQKENIFKLEILESRHLKSGVWSKPQKLSFVQKEFSYAHPALSPSGTQLFFASDQKGGFGGVDIYVSNFENGAWGKPINLGPEINTEGDEFYPYFRKDGYLFFASDGHLGLGGQDIFKSRQAKDGTWQKVENCGAVINSAFDDFGISFSDDLSYGFFSSNRTSGKGLDDIYFFKKTAGANDQLIFVSNLETGENIVDSILCINSCDSSRIYIQSPFNKNKLSTCCEIILTSPDYDRTSIQLCEQSIKEQDTLHLFLSHKHSNLNGLFVDKASSLPITGAKVTINSTAGDHQTSMTDSQGKYHFTLKENACYTGQIEWNDAAIPLNQSFCTQNHHYEDYDLTTIFEQTPVEAEKQALNKKISNVFDVSPSYTKGKTKEVSFLLKIYYDVGRASVRKSAFPELRKLLALLKENPSISIEISSHTDSNGPQMANLKLSKRRANAIKNWLVKKGIASDRIIAIGYGESLPVNHCVDGVKCSEEALQLNRRTEFKLITTTAEID